MATLEQPLPIKPQRRKIVRTHTEMERRFFVHFGIYLVVNIGLALMNIQKNSDHLWFYWVAAGWGLGMVFHAVNAFGLDDDEDDDE